MEVVEVQGLRVPRLGLGTWRLQRDEAAEAVRHALELGYRHVDTARMYGNEAAVGRGLRASGVDRDDVWLTTKLWHDELDPPAVEPAVRESLGRLGVDRVDLLLVHWPSSRGVPPEATLEAMTAVRDRGLTRAIGVSNFPPGLLRRALDAAPVVCDQVEYHPFLSQAPLRALCEERDVLLTAYQPLAKARVLDEPVLVEIGRAHGVLATQVALRWLLDQPNVAAIPRSSKPRNRASNLDLSGFTLSEDERARIDALARGQRFVDPPFAPDWAA